MKRIVIIGGGGSGLAAAGLLARRGVKATVCSKPTRLSGSSSIDASSKLDGDLLAELQRSTANRARRLARFIVAFVDAMR